MFVELAGVEPASKQETNMVSTCLSFCWLSGTGWQEAADLNLIPLRFRLGPGKERQTILAWMVPHIQSPTWSKVLRDISPPTT